MWLAFADGQEELLKRIGEKHAQYDFMKTLATKCAYLLFGREHVHAVLKEIPVYKDSETKDLAATGLSLLVVGIPFQVYCVMDVDLT